MQISLEPLEHSYVLAATPKPGELSISALLGISCLVVGILGYFFLSED